MLRVCSTVVLNARVQKRHEHEYRLLIRDQPSCVSTRWHVAGRVVTILQLPWCRRHDILICCHLPSCILFCIPVRCNDHGIAEVAMNSGYLFFPFCTSVYCSFFKWYIFVRSTVVKLSRVQHCNGNEYKIVSVGFS